MRYERPLIAMSDECRCKEIRTWRVKQPEQKNPVHHQRGAPCAHAGVAKTGLEVGQSQDELLLLDLFWSQG